MSVQLKLIAVTCCRKKLPREISEGNCLHMPEFPWITFPQKELYLTIKNTPDINWFGL